MHIDFPRRIRECDVKGAVCGCAGRIAFCVHVLPSASEMLPNVHCRVMTHALTFIIFNFLNTLYSVCSEEGCNGTLPEGDASFSTFSARH
jgi:hypothetical protein